MALTAEMRIFRGAEGDFGRVTAIADRDIMLPGMPLYFLCSLILFFITSALWCTNMHIYLL
jgi:hypothetical protein